MPTHLGQSDLTSVLQNLVGASHSQVSQGRRFRARTASTEPNPFGEQENGNY